MKGREVAVVRISRASGEVNSRRSNRVGAENSTIGSTEREVWAGIPVDASWKLSCLRASTAGTNQSQNNNLYHK